MIGRKAAVGLSLIGALLAFAFMAQSAFAVSAINTTAVTCTEGAGANDFSDAHCDTNVGAGKGKFGHTEIEKNVETKVTVTNAKTKGATTESTPAIQKGSIFGVKSEITCNTVTGTGTLTNSEPVSKQHKVTGNVTAEFTKCTVNKPGGFGCKVKEPIKVTSNVEGVEGLGAGKNEMGLEFKPKEGEVFAEIIIEGCFLKGTFKVTGTAIGTGTPAPTEKHSGTTNVFTNAMTKETLKLAGNPAEISSSTTVTTTGGSPVALTTAT
jgi:hypothetical protein